MFYYDKSFDLSLSDYGIFVPMLDQRVSSIRKYLMQETPNLLCSPRDSFNFNNLRFAHDSEFADKLITSPRTEIEKTFELIAKDGSYHRYDPDKASKELSGLTNAVFSQTQGTIETVLTAYQKGFAFNLGGGLHHAMTFAGRGFCLINDIVIAAKKILEDKKEVQHLWIIDIDAHKGDGTAQICQNDPNITTLSIHMKHGWPLDNGNDTDPWFIPSDIDIPIASDEQGQYLQLLEEGLAKLEGNFPKADMAIVVQGSDPYEKDGLASSSLLSLSKEDMLRRDQIVYQFLKKRNIPQAYVISGGYGEFAYEIYLQFIESIKKYIIKL